MIDGLSADRELLGDLRIAEPARGEQGDGLLGRREQSRRVEGAVGAERAEGRAVGEVGAAELKGEVLGVVEGLSKGLPGPFPVALCGADDAAYSVPHRRGRSAA